MAMNDCVWVPSWPCAWQSGSDNVEQTDKADNEPDVAGPVAEKTHSPEHSVTGNAEPQYFVNALSTNGLRMMFDGCLAAPSRPPLRILVDTGANKLLRVL